MKSLQTGVLLAIVGMGAFSTGCGKPEFYKCNGVVTHEGKPVPHLQITFQPDKIDSVRPPIAVCDANGKFEMTCGREYGVPPGSYTIFLEDPGAADGRKTSTAPDYLYVIDRYSTLKSDLKFESNRHQSNYEIKADKKDYTGPKVKPMEMKNTTDPAVKPK